MISSNRPSPATALTAGLSLLSLAPAPLWADPPPLPEAYEVVRLDAANVDPDIDYYFINSAGQLAGPKSLYPADTVAVFDGEAIHLVEHPLLLDVPVQGASDWDPGYPWYGPALHIDLKDFNDLGQALITVLGWQLNQGLRVDPDGGVATLSQPSRQLNRWETLQVESMSAQGRVVGAMTDPRGVGLGASIQAFVWDDGPPEVLPTAVFPAQRAHVEGALISDNGRFVLGWDLGDFGEALLWDLEGPALPEPIHSADALLGVTDAGAAYYRDLETQTLTRRDRLGAVTTFPKFYREGRYCQVDGDTRSTVAPNGWVLLNCAEPALVASPEDTYFLEDRIVNPPQGMSLYHVWDMNARGQILAYYVPAPGDTTGEPSFYARLDPVGIPGISGACQLPEGRCLLHSEDACDHWGGAFAGVGTRCL